LQAPAVANISNAIHCMPVTGLYTVHQKTQKCNSLNSINILQAVDHKCISTESTVPSGYIKTARETSGFNEFPKTQLRQILISLIHFVQYKCLSTVAIQFNI